MCGLLPFGYMICTMSLKDVILTVLTPNVSGIILRNVSDVSVQLTTTYSSYDHYCLGIAIYEADSVDLQLSSAYNCTYGVGLHNTSNGHINDITATHNMWGVVLLGGRDNDISNTNVAHNSFHGMSLGNTPIFPTPLQITMTGMECAYYTCVTPISPVQLQHTTLRKECTYGEYKV